MSESLVSSGPATINFSRVNSKRDSNIKKYFNNPVGKNSTVLTEIFSINCKGNTCFNI